MAYFINGYPYSDTHNLNLDWVIDTLKRVETELGQLHDGLEIHVTGNDGTEIYTFTVKANGVYITRTDGGTPFFYNFDTQTLHAPYFDGQSFLFASGRTTGQMRAGSLVLDNALPVAQGGTGSTNAAGARNALGAMASDAVIPVSQGGTGAPNAAGAREALGAVNKGGDTMTGPLNVAAPLATYHNTTPGIAYKLTPDGSPIGESAIRNNTRQMFFREYASDTAFHEDYMLPAHSTGTTGNAIYNILTTKQTLVVPTPASGVTINAGGVIQLGRVAIVSMQITTTATIGRDSALVTGLPTALFTNELVSGLNNSFSSTPFRAGSNALYPSASLAAGVYYINGAYLTT